MTDLLGRARVSVGNAGPGVVARLRPHHGRVHLTTLAGDVEEAASRALE